MMDMIKTPAAHELPQYLREFNDFDHTPALPAGFSDVSWHNDSCPSFLCEATSHVLYLNYQTPALREFPDACFVLDADQATLYSGDDLAEGLRVVQALTATQRSAMAEAITKHMRAAYEAEGEAGDFEAGEQYLREHAPDSELLAEFHKWGGE